MYLYPMVFRAGKKAASGSRTKRFRARKLTFCLKQTINLRTPRTFFTQVAWRSVKFWTRRDGRSSAWFRKTVE